MSQISLEDAGHELGLNLDESLAGPEPVVLLRRGEPVAAIVPILLVGRGTSVEDQISRTTYTT